MADYFVCTSVVFADEDDYNDGLDTLGFNLSTASYTSSSNRLTETGAFTGYSFTLGDRIYCSHASITDGLYDIISKVNNNTIEVDLGGSDLSNVSSSSGPWQTLHHAASVVSAGDNVYLCVVFAGEEFEPFTEVTLTTSGDTTNGSITWNGANKQGYIDGTYAVVDMEDNTESGFLFDEADYNLFRNIKVRRANGSPSAGFKTGSANVKGPVFYNCIAEDCYHGFFFLNVDDAVLVNCYAVRSDLQGFVEDTTNDNSLILYSCTSENNGSLGGFRMRNAVMINCISYNNDVRGFRGAGNIINCLAANNGGDGIGITSDMTAALIINSILVNNGGYGIEGSNEPRLLLNNSFYNNTSGEVETSGVPHLTELEEERLSLPGNPLADPSKGDFRLNTQRAGLLCKSSGYAPRKGGFIDGDDTYFSIGDHDRGPVFPGDDRAHIG